MIQQRVFSFFQNCYQETEKPSLVPPSSYVFCGVVFGFFLTRAKLVLLRGSYVNTVHCITVSNVVLTHDTKSLLTISQYSLLPHFNTITNLSISSIIPCVHHLWSISLRLSGSRSTACDATQWGQRYQRMSEE